MAKRDHVKRIVSASWHRNGVDGAGFYAVLFEPHTHYERRMMFAALFDEPHYCAVVDVDMLHEGVVTFGTNSWRGDNFERELRPLLDRYLAKEGSDGSIRVGPFAIPTRHVHPDELELHGG